MPLTLNPLVPEEEKVNPLLPVQQEEAAGNVYYESYKNRSHIEDIAKATNQPVVSIFSQMRDYTSDEVDSMFLGTVQNQVNETVNDAIMASVNDPDTVAAIIELSRETEPQDVWEAEGWAHDPADVYRAEVAREVAVLNLQDDATVGNWLREFFIPLAAKDAADLAGTNDVVSVQRFVRPINARYNALPPEKKMEVLPILAEEALKAADGNPVVAARLVDVFTGPEDEVDFLEDKIGTGLALYDIATLGTGLT